MKNILIIPNITKDTELSVSRAVARVLKDAGAFVFVEKKYSEGLSEVAEVIDSAGGRIELIVVIGGDGSVIDASVLAIKLDIPVIGVNLGNIGYLAEIETGELELLKRITEDDFRIEEKMLLTVELEENGGTLVSERLALNDVIISHESYVGLAELYLTDSHGATVKYRADGLILSTPVGSTAYSLSAGGPIVSHDIDSITATPICPHSFFNRSVIFNSTERLCLSNNGKEPLNITVDGRHFAALEAGMRCYVSTATKKFKMLTLGKNNMFSTLFGKMKRFENI
ncbi:MAG: NAD(+)/NADH kinase [Clostridia bacterium]|nr:NAD(+)/NADH kinase [Clostridia bacterium]